MKSTGWKADAMPIVFWSSPTEGWTGNPHVAEGMQAVVALPNGDMALVDEVRYQGINGGAHHWQGRLTKLDVK